MKTISSNTVFNKPKRGDGEKFPYPHAFVELTDREVAVIAGGISDATLTSLVRVAAVLGISFAITPAATTIIGGITNIITPVIVGWIRRLV